MITRKAEKLKLVRTVEDDHGGINVEFTQGKKLFRCAISNWHDSIKKDDFKAEPCAELYELSVNSTLSTKRGRKLFRKGDKVRLQPDTTNFDGHNTKMMTVLEDEGKNLYDGVWVNQLPLSFLSGNRVMYKRNGKIRKGTIEYNGKTSTKKEQLIQDDNDRKIRKVKRENIVGFYMKDYILEKA